MRKFNEFNGRKVVHAATRQGLLDKIKDSETRNWKLIGEISQYKLYGHWLCVMELSSRKEVAGQ